MSSQKQGQKGKEQISTVEELHDYLHVTNPRLWVFLLTIMSLIIGLIVYASMITLDNTVQTTAIVSVLEEAEGDEEVRLTTVQVPDGYEGVIKVGMRVLIGNESGTICAVDKDLSVMHDEDAKLEASVELDNASSYLPDGTYDATITIESASPLSFMFN